MPIAIPEHLQDLRIDGRGRPVPWINVRGQWDVPDRYRVAHDPAVDKMAAYYDDDPDGEPDFAHQLIQRQRASMVFGICQVCARPVDWDYRWLALSEDSVEIIDLEALKVPVVTEPWLCPDCKAFAAKHCPMLRRRRRRHHLKFVPVRSPDECQLVVSSGWIEGPYEEATKAEPVAMWCKIMLFNVDIRPTSPRRR